MNTATLMVHVELARKNTALLSLARDLAERLGAGVIGEALCQPIRVLYNDGYVPVDLIEKDRQQIDEEMTAAEAEFRRIFGRAAMWRGTVTSKSLAAELAKEARCADLIITGVDRNAPLFDTSRHVDIGDLVMQAGRPCLIIPAGLERLALDHVMIGWKDAGATRRAVLDALPLLKLAARVTVVEITTEAERAAAQGRLADVSGWLGRHGVEAGATALLSAGDDAQGLEAIAAKQRADLLVAGAYGHSRVREWVLGGVTRDLLLQARRAALVSH